MLAVVYARVSTEDQARHGYSLADQVARCEARARALGADEVRVFTDPGASAALLDRPGLTAARHLVRAGGVSLFVCCDPDRLARNLSHQLLLTEELERHGARLEFISFEWKDTSEGRLFYSLRGAIAEYEKEKIRERTGRGKLAKAHKGGLPQYYRPYGYRFNQLTDTLELDPEEAAAVRCIYRWFTSQPDLSFSAIARRLEDMGFRPARNTAGRWDRTTVKGILENEVYAGRAYVHRWDAGGVAYNRQRPPGERRGYRQRPRGEWIAIPVPAIIEESTWEAARRWLEQVSRRRGVRHPGSFLLSRLVWCGCGAGMSGKRQLSHGKLYRYYVCSAGRRGTGCGARQVQADRVETLVWERVRAWLTDLASCPTEVRSLLPDDGRAGLQQELARVEAEIGKLQQGRENLMQLLQRGSLLPAEAERMLAANRQAVTRLQERRQELADHLADRGRAAADPERLPRLAAAVRSRLDELTGQERQRLLRLLIERVTVHADGRVVVAARLGGPAPPGTDPGTGRACTPSGDLPGGCPPAGQAGALPRPRRRTGL